MERERAHKQGKRQRERKGEADPRWAGSLMWDWIPDPGTRTRAEGRQPTNWATQELQTPGFKKIIWQARLIAKICKISFALELLGLIFYSQNTVQHGLCF